MYLQCQRVHHGTTCCIPFLWVILGKTHKLQKNVRRKSDSQCGSGACGTVGREEFDVTQRRSSRGDRKTSDRVCATVPTSSSSHATCETTDLEARRGRGNADKGLALSLRGVMASTVGFCTTQAGGHAKARLRQCPSKAAQPRFCLLARGCHSEGAGNSGRSVRPCATAEKN